MPKETLFSKCVDRRVAKNGRTEIRCKLGLWGVYSSDKKQAETEARHYWIQYFDDGEYDVLLGIKEKKLCYAP